MRCKIHIWYIGSGIKNITANIDSESSLNFCITCQQRSQCLGTPSAFLVGIGIHVHVASTQYMSSEFHFHPLIHTLCQLVRQLPAKHQLKRSIVNVLQYCIQKHKISQQSFFCCEQNFTLKGFDSIVRLTHALAYNEVIIMYT